MSQLPTTAQGVASTVFFVARGPAVPLDLLFPLCRVTCTAPWTPPHDPAPPPDSRGSPLTRSRPSSTAEAQPSPHPAGLSREHFPHLRARVSGVRPPPCVAPRHPCSSPICLSHPQLVTATPWGLGSAWLLASPRRPSHPPGEQPGPPQPPALPFLPPAPPPARVPRKAPPLKPYLTSCSQAFGSQMPPHP